MPHSAFDIVQEFLRSPEAQSRKNAVTALAVMYDDRESIERLAKVALTDADESVRSRAVEEMVSLPDGVLPGAVKVLSRALGDDTRRQSAYATLGRLKVSGRDVPSAGGMMSLLSRLRLAWAMNSHAYPVRNTTYRIRSWKPALIGATIGVAVVTAAFIRLVEWRGDDEILLPTLTMILALLTGLLVTQRTTPIDLYFDRPAGFLAEVTNALVCSLLVEIPLLLLLFFIISSPGGASFQSALVLGVPLTVGVARATTLLAHGVGRGRGTNTFLQVAASAATLFLLLAAVNFVLWGIDPLVAKEVTTDYGYSYTEVNPPYRMMEAFWMVLPPVGLAAALAFARIDSKSYTPVGRLARARPFAGRAGRAFTYGTMLLAVVLLTLITLVGRKEIPHRVVNINTTFERLRDRIKPQSEADTFSPRP